MGCCASANYDDGDYQGRTELSPLVPRSTQLPASHSRKWGDTPPKQKSVERLHDQLLSSGNREDWEDYDELVKSHPTSKPRILATPINKKNWRTLDPRQRAVVAKMIHDNEGSRAFRSRGRPRMYLEQFIDNIIDPTGSGSFASVLGPGSPKTPSPRYRLDVARFIDQETMCDLKIVLSSSLDTRPIPLHRLVLAQNSRRMEKLLTSSWNDTSVVSINGVERPAAIQLLQLFYQHVNDKISFLESAADLALHNSSLYYFLVSDTTYQKIVIADEVVRRVVRIDHSILARERRNLSAIVTHADLLDEILIQLNHLMVFILKNIFNILADLDDLDDDDKYFLYRHVHAKVTELSAKAHEASMALYNIFHTEIATDEERLSFASYFFERLDRVRRRIAPLLEKASYNYPIKLVTKFARLSDQFAKFKEKPEKQSEVVSELLEALKNDAAGFETKLSDSILHSPTEITRLWGQLRQELNNNLIFGLWASIEPHIQLEFHQIEELVPDLDLYAKACAFIADLRSKEVAKAVPAPLPVRWHSLLSRLDTKDTFSDVKVCAEDFSSGEMRTIHAHRIILTASSAVFDGMLSGAFQESASRTIIIRDWDYSIVLILLQWIYSSGAIELLSELRKTFPSEEQEDEIWSACLDLAQCADQYGVDSLKIAAEDILLQLIRKIQIVENEPLQLLQVAERLHLLRLKETLMDFMSTHFDILEVKTLSSSLGPALLASFVDRIETMQSNAIRVELVLVAATEKVSLDPFLSCMFSSDFITQFSLEHPEKRGDRQVVSKYLKIIGNALVKISVSVVTDLRHIDDVIDICVSQDSVLLEFFVLYPQGDERMQLEALRTKEAIRQSMKGIVLERAHLAISAEAGWPSMTHLVAIPTQDTNKQLLIAYTRVLGSHGFVLQNYSNSASIDEFVESSICDFIDGPMAKRYLALCGAPICAHRVVSSM